MTVLTARVLCHARCIRGKPLEAAVNVNVRIPAVEALVIIVPDRSITVTLLAVEVDVVLSGQP